MKKTYRPLARTEKASQMFKKKTLNVNDDLNIKVDEDDIENVDDYWNTAVSVIGNSTIDSIDHSVLTEVSDTLFNITNIRKSIRGGDYEENDTEAQPWNKAKENTENREVPLVEIHQKEDKKSTISKKPIEGGNQLEFSANIDGHNIGIVHETKSLSEDKNKQLKEVSMNHDNDLNSVNEYNNNMFDISNNDLPHQESALIANNSEDEKIADEIDVGKNEILTASTSEKKTLKPKYLVLESPDCYPIDVSDLETEFPKRQIKKLKENDNQSFEMAVLKTFSSAKSPSASPAKEKKAENKKPQNKPKNHSFMIENAIGPNKNNVTTPLVCSASIDTALMTLDYLAYSNDFKTPNSFSIFVIKGKIQISVNGNTKVAAKGDVAIVEKDDVFSLNCLSVNGAKLLLSYVL